ncbi:ATP-binding protein [Sporosarcina sp. HYO08]|uniref:ATP-binding protein n=1 Tax=Sporosarcina sp. HYO08 TaxID=1759557 RepID=UPI0007939D4F|nr:ATP-binding protein [Sporosarcina sp. HYO08]KXH82049.1 histidine kinase [Sporosarcina sp. HYO08]
MNRIWNSIVGKLWATILLLVSFVLFIVTVLLLEFLDDFHTEQAEDSLRREATTIGKIVEDHESESSMKLIIQDILDVETSAMIIDENGKTLYAFHHGLNADTIEQKILTESSLLSMYNNKTPVVKEMMLPSNKEEGVMEQYLVLIQPFQQDQELVSSVVMYQSLEAIHRTTKRTTHIVVLSAFIAFILTTVFAFFLSTRITSPLRGLRQAAFELSKGNFDTKLPVTSTDELGQLATAFNQMGRQLKYHVELISQEKEQLSSILTSMADAVITFNRDFTILSTNPQADRVLQNWYLKNGAEDEPIPPEIFHMLEHVLSFAEEVEDELELNGRFYDISISPLYSRGNNIRGAVAVLRDMTEQHKLDKLRSDFIANVSHELRTPISMLQGYSEAIIDGVIANDEERDEMIQVIHDESMRMGRLVTDLLDLARMESGHKRLYKDDVSMVPFLDRIVTKFTQVARDAEVSLTLDVPQNEEVILHVDEDRLEQVFTNLIDNAIRHTPIDGNVTVALRQYGQSVELTVKDTGVGIPEEDLPFIFERFYKADKARTRGKGGTGLGLAIAKNIIDLHGGEISARRGEEKGTIFSCILPLTATGSSE